MNNKVLGLLTASLVGAEVIPNLYVVKFKEDAFGGIAGIPDKAEWVNSVLDEAGSIAVSDVKNEVTDDYDLPGFQAFGGIFSAEAASVLADQPEVEYVEESNVYSIVQSGSQSNPIWNLDATDDRSGLDGTYTWTNTGSGVTAYVIDTGIQSNHPDFQGRASSPSAANFVDNSSNDGNGHGTHVAGTIGSATYGIAKRVRLVGVKVLNSRGTGSLNGVINGINWVARNAPARSVANLSLGGPFSRAINDAVNGLIRSGVTTVLAAGNENQDACNVSPASVPAAITVGNTQRGGRRNSLSNWGRCVDIFAPGTSITSTWNNGRTRSISGTSMAAPHVAGVAAIYLQGSNLSPAQVASRLTQRATRGAVSDPRGSPNLLLYSL